MKQSFQRCLTALLILLMLPVPRVYAWTDQTHMAVGVAAGLKQFQNCAAADVSHDVAKINGLNQTDSQAHFFNVPDDYEITAADVYAQLEKIGKSAEECPNGYVLGAIVHTARLCGELTQSGAFDDYYYAVLLHYIADLAEPLHVSLYDDFNRSHHFACDNVLSDREAEYPVFAAVELADKLTVDDEFRIETEEALVDAIVTLARQSQKIAITMRQEDRMITREEALLQASRAATLSRAVMRYCGKIA